MMPETERSKIIRIFRYLKELDVLREQVASPSEKSPVAASCPQPPEELLNWLQPGWKLSENAGDFNPEREFELDSGIFCHVFFRDDTARVSLWHQWMEERNAWIQTARTEIALPASESIYQKAVNRILTELDGGEAISPALLNVVGLATQKEPSASVDVAGAADAQFLLSKPFNEEQIRIARRITHNDAVLVQGPPGTGKTHSIANLLGHFLADGKTVLVTAHNSGALRLLREMVEPAVRPLCLAVLDGDVENAAQLDAAVHEITRRLAEEDADALLHEAAGLDARRKRILTELSDAKTALFNARFGEMQEISACGKTFSPFNAAQIVRDGVSKNDWLPGPLAPSVPPPLTQREAAFLYQTAHLLSADDERALTAPLPDPRGLPGVSDVAQLISEQLRLGASAALDREEIWQPVDPPVRVEQLDALQPKIRTVANTIRDASGWWLEIVRAGREGGVTRAVWEELVEQVKAVNLLSDSIRPILMAHGPHIEPLSEDERGADDAVTLHEICEHLKISGTLSVWTKTTRRAWHKLIDRAKVNGQTPEKPEHFEALESLMNLKAAREALRTRWQRQVTEAGGTDAGTLGAQPEKGAAAIASDIRLRLDWHDKQWLPLFAQLEAAGFQWDAFASGALLEGNEFGDIARLRAAIGGGLENLIKSHRDALRLKQSELEFANAAKTLQSFSDSPVVQRALSALLQHDAIGYSDAGRDMSRLASLQVTSTQRLELLRKLDAQAPAWAAFIRAPSNFSDGMDVPSEVEAAWQWRQLHDELECRAEISLNELQDKITALDNELKKVTAQLIERKAWAVQKLRSSPERQAALEGYVGCVQKLAEGHSGRETELQDAARENLIAAREAIPVWIMPLTRVYENLFSTRGSHHFDVVIIDEASQCDLSSLAALHLAEKCIIIGDDEQVSPAPFADLAAVQALINNSLEDIPSRELYDPESSVYHLARSFFKERIFLREHFRSVPEIVQFSNELCYDGRIVAMRDGASSPVKPALAAHFAFTGKSDDKVNRVEAETVAALLLACLEQPEYATNDLGQPASFGVISMRGVEQSALIDEILRTHIQADEFSSRRILCGTAEQFQGDERDVVFLSLVDSDEALPALGFGPKEVHRKLFNVASSRARNQMWVVHSLGTKLQPDDLRRRIIEYAQHPETLMNVKSSSQIPAVTPLIIAVQEYLTQRGFYVDAQWPVGTTRISLVARSGERRLAIECDGDRTITALELAHDMERQSALERTGWRFVRVRGSLFVRDAERAMQPVLEALAKFNIRPKEKPFVHQAEVSDEALIQRVQKRAAAIRYQWHKDAPDSSVVVVGDWVDFFLVDAPNSPQTVNLVTTPTNLDKLEVNIGESLAKALIGRAANEKSVLDLGDSQCEIQVLVIHKERPVNAPA